MIIGISGKINSGKDTVAAIIQYLVWKNKVEKGEKINLHYTFKDFTNSKFGGNTLSNWQIKKFADKLKDIVCILIGCTREQLEDREFKEKELEEEWWKYKVTYRTFDRLSYTPYGEWFTEFYSSEKEAELCTDGNIELDENSKTIELIKLTPRLLLQLLGTNCGRNIIHPNIWVNATFIDFADKEEWFRKETGLTRTEYLTKNGHSNEYKTLNEQFFKSLPNWIISDVRFPNELKAIKDKGGITIRVERIPKIRVQHSGQEDDFTLVDYDPTNQKHVDLLKGERITSKEHESETALDNYTFDYVIENNGTIEDLIEKVKEILIKEKVL